jgi:hypothetical protein
MNGFDKAQNLLDSFEKNCVHNEGLDDLSHALEILSALLDSKEEIQVKRKTKKLISSNRQFVLSQIHSLLDNPIEHTYREFDYWGRVIQEYLDFGLGDKHLMLIEKKLLYYRKNTRYDSLTQQGRYKEMLSEFKQKIKDDTLSEEERENFTKVIQTLNKVLKEK